MFADRTQAGRALAEALTLYGSQVPVVLGVPRGGVVVAAEVAHALHAPLDVIVVRKLRAPMQPELAMGVVGEGGSVVLNDEVIAELGVTTSAVATESRHRREELEQSVERLRAGRSAEELTGRTAIVVDDGVATGATALAACRIARRRGASRVVLATPVMPADVVRRFRQSTDDVVALEKPAWFMAVGQWYEDFEQVTDEEVAACLAGSVPGSGGLTVASDVDVDLGDVSLRGRLTVPERAETVVVFAHGSGSSSASPRNRYVADILVEAGFATLLFDLLTRSEERDRANVFDIDLLADRLVRTTEWLAERPATSGLRVAYFGASTGAAAALQAAARSTRPIAAVVSRGGRADMADAYLSKVAAPVRLIVGGDDDVVLELNREAQSRMRCTNDLVIVPGATHLFEEPGGLEAVGRLASEWFLAHARSTDEVGVADRRRWWQRQGTAG